MSLRVPPIPVNSYQVTPDLVIDCARLIQDTQNVTNVDELSQLLQSDIFLNLAPFIAGDTTHVVGAEIDDANGSKVYIFKAELISVRIEVVILVFQMKGNGLYPISDWGFTTVDGLPDARVNREVASLWASVRADVEAAVRGSGAANKAILCTGQQVSAAVAGLANISLSSTLQSEGFLGTSILFGCPRFADSGLFNSHTGLNVFTHRVNLKGDPQVSTPPASAGYIHVGREQNINGPHNVTYCADDASEVAREPALLYAAIVCVIVFLITASFGSSGILIHGEHMTRRQHNYESHEQSFYAFLSFTTVWVLVLLMCGLTAWNAYATATQYPERVQTLLQGAPNQAETVGNLCKKQNEGVPFLVYAGVALAAFIAGSLIVEELGLRHGRFSMAILAFVIVGAMVPAFTSLA